MNWINLAKLLIPILGVAVPGAAPLVPLILHGVVEAEAIHGAGTGPVKKAHVLQLVRDGADAVSASGKVVIDAEKATDITTAVFRAVDGVHAIVQENQATQKLG